MDRRGIRVMVVDDHQLVREGVASMLAREPDLDLVESVSSGEEAVARVAASDPDVVVLDYRLPGMTGATACRALLEKDPTISVVALTGFASEEIVLAFLAAGARGYLCKDIARNDLSDAIRRVAAGEYVLVPEVTGVVIRWVQSTEHRAIDSGLLSPLEIEILSMVANGRSNQEIAASLNRSTGTIKANVHNIMRKLGVNRRWEAVAVGVKRGVI